MLFNHSIPSKFLFRFAQIVPEQTLNESIDVYEDAIPYIRCQIQSTIQHEAGHRRDEETRNQQILKQKQTGYPYNDLARAAQQIMPFNQFTDESRAESIAEKEEEECDSLLPPELSDQVTSINLNQLFEEAKTAAKIEPEYKSDIHAGHLPPEAQGMFMMKDREGLSAEDLIKLKSSSGNVHIDENNNLWVDVRKIVEPFIVKDEIKQNIKPPTFQGTGDGAVYPDLPGVSQIPPQNSAQSISPSPAVQGREAR